MAYSLDLDSKKSIQMTIPDDEFSCPLCLENLDEPKSLPGCAHNFCKTCLHGMVTRNETTSISCPVCRVPSSVPENGADGFPTNTLLVRLMDNIPGRKEKKELLKAVKCCKDEIERNRKIHEDIEKLCTTLERNKELAEELKTQVSECAKNYIEDIKKCEQKLCKNIDDRLSQSCGGSYQNKLDMDRKKLETSLEEASNCVYSVEDILMKDELSEIQDMKTLMVEQLSEYSKFPVVTSVSHGRKINAFDIKFEKDKTDRENVLGRIVKKNKAGLSGDNLIAEQHLSFGTDEEIIEFNSASSREPIAQASCSHAHPFQQHPDFEDGETRVITRVDLPFEPFRIAVCPRRGDVALLSRESNKVYIYNVSGTLLSVIQIRYGDLWDIGFSDEQVVVVNRAHNRLLFYTKAGQFIVRDIEEPRTCLKYAYLSIAEDGRLIVTSARIRLDDDDDDDDDEDEEEVVQCIIVCEHEENTFKRMFGRRHLEHPVSRAVFHHGMYYIADEINHSNDICIKSFNSQGKAISSIEVGQSFPGCFVSLTRDIDCDRLLKMGSQSSHNLIHVIESPNVTSVGYEGIPSVLHFQQKEVLSKSFYPYHFEGILLVEIFKDQNWYEIVNYCF